MIGHVLARKADLTPDTRDASTQIANPEVHQEFGARVSGVSRDAAASGQDNPDETCSICMENVYERKLPKHKTFGILPNCVHAFCEPCIMTGRQMDRYRPDVVKGCPVCRVRSDFYVPSESMMEGEEKEQLIISTKQRCREEFCSFFDESGSCSFEEDCRHLTARRPEHQEEEEGAEDDSDGEDAEVFVFTSVVRMGEENLGRFLAAAHNSPDALREFMMRFL